MTVTTAVWGAQFLKVHPCWKGAQRVSHITRSEDHMGAASFETLFIEIMKSISLQRARYTSAVIWFLFLVIPRGRFSASILVHIGFTAVQLSDHTLSFIASSPLSKYIIIKFWTARPITPENVVNGNSKGFPRPFENSCRKRLNLLLK